MQTSGRVMSFDQVALAFETRVEPLFTFGE
jgi:hypothetical protein